MSSAVLSAFKEYMTTDNKKPRTVYEMNDKGELEERGDLSLPPFNDKGELNSKSLKEAMIAITKLAAELDAKDAAVSFAKALDAIPTAKHSVFVGEDPTRLEVFDEWKHLESRQYVHSFWNNSSNYQLNFTFSKKNARRKMKESQAKAEAYLKKNSALFTSFGREDFKMKTDLFDAKCFVSEGKRIVEFKPKKMKVFHQSIWGADLLSDIAIDPEDLSIKRQLVDVKVEIDRWNLVTGFLIIREGIVSAFPMIEYQKEFRSRMKDIGAASLDCVSAPFQI